MKLLQIEGSFTVVLMCLLAPTALTGQSETQVAPWQRSWDAFVDDLQTHFASGEHMRNFEEKVVGKAVTWDGTFRKLYKPSAVFGPPPDESLADIAFTPRKVRMDGVDAQVTPPPLRVSNAEVSRWQRLARGSTVRVRMTLRLARMLPTLFVTDTREAGKGSVIFFAQDGELVEVLKRPRQK